MKRRFLIGIIFVLMIVPLAAQKSIHSNIGCFGNSHKSNGYYLQSFSSILGTNLENIENGKSILLRPFNFSNSPQIEKNLQITIFPNPTTDKIFFRTDLESVTYTVFNSSGSICKTGNTHEIDLSDHSNGVYLVNIYQKQGLILSQKIILQK